MLRAGALSVRQQNHAAVSFSGCGTERMLLEGLIGKV